MATCDLCNLPAGVESVYFECEQFRTAMRKGLRPPDTALMVGMAFGIKKEQAVAGWMMQVMSDESDWVLCGSCSRLAVQAGAVGSSTHNSHDFLTHIGQDRNAQTVADTFAKNELYQDPSYYGTGTFILEYFPDLASLQQFAGKPSLLQRLFSKPPPPGSPITEVKSCERGSFYVSGEVRLLSPSLVFDIARLGESHVAAAAKAWVSERRSRAVGWSETHLVEKLGELSDVARKARSEKRPMFWCIGRSRFTDMNEQREREKREAEQKATDKCFRCKVPILSRSELKQLAASRGWHIVDDACAEEQIYNATLKDIEDHENKKGFQCSSCERSYCMGCLGGWGKGTAHLPKKCLTCGSACKRLE